MGRFTARLRRIERRHGGPELGRAWYDFLALFRASAKEPADPFYGASDAEVQSEADDLAATGQPASLAGLMLAIRAQERR